MGTPFSIVIIEEGRERNNRAMVDGGSNGISECVVPFLKRGYDFMVRWAEEKCSRKPELGRPEYYGYIRGRAEKVAAFLCATDPEFVYPGCHECGSSLGGEEFQLYLVNRAKGTAAENPVWEVRVEEVRLPLEELAKRYKK